MHTALLHIAHCAHCVTALHKCILHSGVCACDRQREGEGLCVFHIVVIRHLPAATPISREEYVDDSNVRVEVVNARCAGFMGHRNKMAAKESWRKCLAARKVFQRINQDSHR
jgi:hypothetical protein